MAGDVTLERKNLNVRTRLRIIHGEVAVETPLTFFSCLFRLRNAAVLMCHPCAANHDKKTLEDSGTLNKRATPADKHCPKL